MSKNQPVADLTQIMQHSSVPTANKQAAQAALDKARSARLVSVECPWTALTLENAGFRADRFEPPHNRCAKIRAFVESLSARRLDALIAVVREHKCCRRHVPRTSKGGKPVPLADGLIARGDAVADRRWVVRAEELAKQARAIDISDRYDRILTTTHAIHMGTVNAKPHINALFFLLTLGEASLLSQAATFISQSYMAEKLSAANKPVPFPPVPPSPSRSRQVYDAQHRRALASGVKPGSDPVALRDQSVHDGHIQSRDTAAAGDGRVRSIIGRWQGHRVDWPHDGNPPSRWVGWGRSERLRHLQALRDYPDGTDTPGWPTTTRGKPAATTIYGEPVSPCNLEMRRAWEAEHAAELEGE